MQRAVRCPHPRRRRRHCRRCCAPSAAGCLRRQQCWGQELSACGKHGRGRRLLRGRKLCCTLSECSSHSLSAAWLAARCNLVPSSLSIWLRFLLSSRQLPPYLPASTSPISGSARSRLRSRRLLTTAGHCCLRWRSAPSRAARTSWACGEGSHRTVGHWSYR